ncbi:DUF397 domain-containing protein [Nocardia mexicana]|uniref:Uncharacterized protein DUF397 n=1 Tax=Nocardia mexicana TaxID=279262 RepID=A0A370H0N5_9NOCA|nr:DUF397 domain-containing protein [Nocardia mexicana]RDI49312.1 uncharacterized protein DUF397 [Nocardia mexicana]
MTESDAARIAGLPATSWRKSSFSGPDGNCVECAPLPDTTVAVRNSNRPEAGTLVFTRAELAAWIQGCRAGEFDDLM